MSSDNPLVSVVLCTYNAERFIRPTLRSVLNQTYENLEVLVLDNDSDDKTVNVVSSFDDDRVRLFEMDENLGPYQGLNYLIKRADGAYVAVQDHDDIWHERKTEFQVEFLEAHPEYVGSGGTGIKFLEAKDWVAVPDADVDNPVQSVPHTTLMFRNDGYTYDPTVGYKTDLYFMEEILCGGDRILYQFEEALHVSRVRADDGNLSFKWTAGLPQNVVSYYRRTGNQKRLLWGLVMTVIPVSAARRLKRHVFDYDLRPVETLEEDEFTCRYRAYLSTESDEKEAR